MKQKLFFFHINGKKKFHFILRFEKIENRITKNSHMKKIKREKRGAAIHEIGQSPSSLARRGMIFHSLPFCLLGKALPKRQASRVGILAWGLCLARRAEKEEKKFRPNKLNPFGPKTICSILSDNILSVI